MANSHAASSSAWGLKSNGSFLFRKNIEKFLKIQKLEIQKYMHCKLMVGIRRVDRWHGTNHAIIWWHLVYDSSTSFAHLSFESNTILPYNADADYSNHEVQQKYISGIDYRFFVLLFLFFYFYCATCLSYARTNGSDFIVLRIRTLVKGDEWKDQYYCFWQMWHCGDAFHNIVWNTNRKLIEMIVGQSSNRIFV